MRCSMCWPKFFESVAARNLSAALTRSGHSTDQNGTPVDRLKSPLADVETRTFFGD